MKKYINGEYIEMSAEEIAEIQARAEAFEREQFYATANQPMSDDELLSAIVASVERGVMPRSGKEGFVLKEAYVPSENRTIWEYVPDPYYVPTEDGTYLHPIQWSGQEVEVGMWYYTDDPELPAEALQSGTPDGWNHQWFDIIA